MDLNNEGQIDSLGSLLGPEESLGSAPVGAAPVDKKKRRRRMVTIGVNVFALAVAGVLGTLAVQQHPRDAPSLCTGTCSDGAAKAFSVGPSAAIAKARAEISSQSGAAPAAGKAAPAPGKVSDVGVAAKIAAPAAAASTGGVSRQQMPSSPVQANTIVIPATGVNAPVDQISIDNGELTIPSDVSRVGSWTGGPFIGSPAGSTLVAGHVDNVDQGSGAFKTLTQMQAGDVVYLNQDGLTTRWVTTDLLEVSKPNLPQSLFVGTTGPRMMHLVSCAGQIHNGSYDDNIIVTLVPLPAT